MADVQLLARRQLLLHRAHPLGVLVQQAAILGAELATKLLHVLLKIVEDAAQRLSVLHAPVELLEHLVRDIDRRQGPVRPGVRHAGPGIGALGHHHAELERAEARARRRVRLEEVLDLLVDGDAARPARRRVRAALDVAGEELDPGEQAADPAHVVVAVAADAVADAVQDQRAVLERPQRTEALLERELLAFLVRPERRRDDAVRAEHHDETLLATVRLSESEAREVHDEGQGRDADAELADEFTSGALSLIAVHGSQNRLSRIAFFPAVSAVGAPSPRAPSPRAPSSREPLSREPSSCASS